MKQQMRPSACHLKPQEIKKLFMAAHDFRNRSILKSLYWLGLRRQELTELDIRDINFERKRVTVRQGKGGKTRIVPIINDELLSDLKHLTAGRKSVPVFMSNQGKGLSL